MIRRFHRLLALSLGLLVSLWTLSGSLLLVQKSLDAGLPGTMASETGQFMPQRILAAARRHLADRPGHWKLVLPHRGQAVAEVTYLSADPFGATAGEVRITVDPRRAEVIRVTEGRTQLAEWLYRFHSRLMLGDQGKWWVGVAGLVLLGFVVSGLLMWRLPRRIGLSGLHGGLGLVVLPVLMFSLVTGWLLVFSGLWTSKVLSGEASPGTENPDGPEITRSMTLTSVLASLRRHNPGCRLRVVETPFEEREPWRAAMDCGRGVDHPVYWRWFLVGPGRDAGVRPDPEMEATGVRSLGWIYALHTGQILGAPGKCLLAAAGGGPTVLLVTGMIIRWSRKRRLRKRHGLSTVQNPA